MPQAVWDSTSNQTLEIMLVTFSADRTALYAMNYYHQMLGRRISTGPPPRDHVGGGSVWYLLVCRHSADVLTLVLSSAVWLGRVNNKEGKPMQRLFRLFLSFTRFGEGRFPMGAG